MAGKSRQPRKFDPDRHCGAKKRDGALCTHVKGFGTDHPGEGRCKFHGGSSTGPKSKAGKNKVAQNAVTHGLYGRVLTGKDLARLKSVQDFGTAEILESNFQMLQAKLMGAVSDTPGRVPKRFEAIYGVAEIMVEGEELEEEVLVELRQRLCGVDLETISRVSMNTASIASAARTAQETGDVMSQLSILRRFMVQVARATEDMGIRRLVVDTIGALKMQAGLPVKEINEILLEVKTAKEEGDDEFEAEESTAAESAE